MADPTSIYGYDTACTSGLRPGYVASGVDQVREHCYRALTTPQGSCPGQGTALSMDVRDLLHEGMTQRELTAIPGQIRRVVLDDDRVQSADIRVSIVGRGASETLYVTISAVLVDGGTFSLILAVSQLTVEILEGAPS